VQWTDQPTRSPTIASAALGVGSGGDDQISQLDEGVLEALEIGPDVLHRIMDGLEREFVDLV